MYFICDFTSLQNDNKLSNQNVQKSVKNSASYSSINIIHIASANPIYYMILLTVTARTFERFHSLCWTEHRVYPALPPVFVKLKRFLIAHECHAHVNFLQAGENHKQIFKSLHIRKNDTKESEQPRKSNQRCKFYTSDKILLSICE